MNELIIIGLIGILALGFYALYAIGPKIIGFISGMIKFNINKWNCRHNRF